MLFRSFSLFFLFSSSFFFSLLLDSKTSSKNKKKRKEKKLVGRIISVLFSRAFTLGWEIGKMLSPASNGIFEFSFRFHSERSFRFSGEHRGRAYLGGKYVSKRERGAKEYRIFPYGSVLPLPPPPLLNHFGRNRYREDGETMIKQFFEIQWKNVGV